MTAQPPLKPTARALDAFKHRCSPAEHGSSRHGTRTVHYDLDDWLRHQQRGPGSGIRSSAAALQETHLLWNNLATFQRQTHAEAERGRHTGAGERFS